ncbi:RDD family protein [Streptomyces sp. NPDC087440]|uniref:RDD family protein n=1 Tax=Streptomyces sp. NPDC087440 TaxID=3365790 RepID=UPI0038229B0F
MSAPTPANGENTPGHGFYPDPSIPGYVRYWNGSSWVPGTSRPAPAPGEPMPTPPPGAAPVAPAGLPNLASVPAPAPSMEETGPFPPAVEETGPFFFDEDDQPTDRPAAHTAQPTDRPADRPADRSSPQPGDRSPARETPAASGHSGRDVQLRRTPEAPVAWQADTSRQSGFGGDHDRRVSWGSPADATPASAPAAASTSGTSPTRPAPGSSRPAASALTPAQDRAPAPRDPRTPADALPARTERPALESTDTAGPPARDAGSPSPLGRRGRPPGAERAGKGAAPGGAAPLAAPRRTPDPAAPTPQASRPTPAPTPPTPSSDGTMSIRTVKPHPRPATAAQPAPTPRGPATGHPQAQGQVQGQAQPQTPVTPWKPPVEDPFTRAAREQANARPASLGRRLAARLLDTIVLGAAVAAVAVPLVTQAVDHIDEKIRAAKLSGTTVTVYLLDSTTVGILGIILGTFLVLGLLYEAVPTAKWGRTLGKKVFGLQVRDIEEHEPPRFGGALRRWLVYGVLGVLGIGVFNVLWCLIDRPWRQCWHDKAARTFVAGKPGSR